MIKPLSFKEEFVSCVNCDACYSAQDGSPTFCQVWSHFVDPIEVEANQARAAKCKQWFPIKRRYAGEEYEEVERWYEKDSMG